MADLRKGSRATTKTDAEQAVRNVLAATQAGELVWLNDRDTNFSAQFGEYALLLRVSWGNDCHLHMGYAGNCESYIASTLESKVSLVNALCDLKLAVRDAAKKPDRSADTQFACTRIILDTLKPKGT